jgi:hypothetical protein
MIGVHRKGEKGEEFGRSERKRSNSGFKKFTGIIG